jgi:hypothetical protein
MGKPRFSSLTPERDPVVQPALPPIGTGWAVAARWNLATAAPRMFWSNSCIHSLESLADI